MLGQAIRLLGKRLAAAGASSGGGVANAVIDATAVLYDTARVSNNLGVREAVRVGRYSHVRGELLTFGHGGSVTVGDYCYVGEQTRIWSAARITVGDRTLISHLVTILDNATHPFSAAARHEQFRAIITGGHPRDIDLRERPVTIGADVLISCHSVVLAGVTIGDGAIVGAGSVVTKDVPPWTVVAGNPARIIRELRDDER
jgi:acetyltransferase-like isoleucine patch superfamily enzyme